MILAMMTFVTIGVIAILLILALAMHHLSPMLAEIDDRFLHIAGAVFILVLCSGIYLSFAVPSIAGEPDKPEDGKIFRDTVQGLQFEE
jgi:succinate-acetate transporter protein